MGLKPQETPRMVPKTSKKTKATKAPKAKREGPHHRAAHLQNAREFACPECWTVPTTIRADGVSVARHLIPEGSKARKFRGTAYCNGQGRIARHVLDEPWTIGEEPKNSISALEFVEHGTAKADAKIAAQAAKEQKRAERATKPKAAKKAPKEPKAKTAKASKPKAAKRPGKSHKAKPEANGEAQPAESPVTA